MRERGSPLFLVVLAVLIAIPAQASSQQSPAPTTTAAPTTTTPTTPSASTTTTIDPEAWPEVTTTTVPAVSESTTPAPAPLNRIRRTRHILWPVPGYLDVASTWGAERDGGTRLHRGNDIMAPKLTPVVAVANGVIGGIHDGAGDCCWIELRHDDGWSSWYIHLNNDTRGTDDGRGRGIRPDLVVGTWVQAGEVIGWVGDSGNAEPGPPHLHFELHMPSVGAIDPYPSLRWARNNTTQPAFPQPFSGAFSDDDGLAAEPLFELLTSLGASTRCDVFGGQSCPSWIATEADVATWVGALAGVAVPLRPPPPPPQFAGGSAAVMVDPCALEGCPPPPLTAGQVITTIFWALRERSAELLPSEAAPLPPPWELSPEAALGELQYRGLADTCPLVALPLDGLVSRAQVVEMIGKAFGRLAPLACDHIS